MAQGALSTPVFSRGNPVFVDHFEKDLNFLQLFLLLVNK
jgi:hypothetical protein